jgi:hypothetical protein
MPTPILQTLFGGGEDQSGLLDDRQANIARRQGLLNAGISVLEASAPSATPKSFAGILAAGLRGGQAGYENSTKEQIGHQQVADQLRVQAARRSVMQQFAPVGGENPTQRLDRLSQAAQALLAQGDIEGAGQISKLLSAMHEQSLKYQFLQGPEGALDVGDPSTGLIKHLRDPSMPADLQALRLENLALQRERLTQTGASHEDQMNLRWTQNFESHNSDIIKSAFSINRARAIFDAAAAGNPAATKSALLNYVRVSDANPQMRQGIFNVLSNIDASWKGKSLRYIAQVWDGTLPPEQLQNLRDVVNRVEKADRARYTSQYNSFLKTHPGVPLMSADDLYNGNVGEEQGEGSASEVDDALGEQ